MIGNFNGIDVPRKKKAKETKSKTKKGRKEPTVTMEPTETASEEVDEIPTEDNNYFEDEVQENLEERVQDICESPQYVPSAEFSDIEETASPEEQDMTPIQLHANIDLATFDVLNAHNVQKLIQERDRLEFGNLRRRHTLLHQIDRTRWPVLFAILQLHGSLPFSYNYESRKHFYQFKLLLYTREDEVLEALKKQYPSQKSASAVDLCSKVIW